MAGRDSSATGFQKTLGVLLNIFLSGNPERISIVKHGKWNRFQDYHRKVREFMLFKNQSRGGLLWGTYNS